MALVRMARNLRLTMMVTNTVSTAATVFVNSKVNMRSKTGNSPHGLNEDGLNAVKFIISCTG